MAKLTTVLKKVPKNKNIKDSKTRPAHKGTDKQTQNKGSFIIDIKWEGGWNFCDTRHKGVSVTEGVSKSPI